MGRRVVTGLAPQPISAAPKNSAPTSPVDGRFGRTAENVGFGKGIARFDETSRELGVGGFGERDGESVRWSGAGG